MVQFGMLAPRPGSEASEWFALHTRSRHEKQVRERLLMRGTESYLPLFPRRREWADRRRTVLWPLFPGYLFVRVAAAEIGPVLTTHGVAAVVGTAGRPTAIARAEIESVRLFCAALVAGAAPCDAEPEPLLDAGDWVRVSEGPFAGVEGMVTRRSGRERVLVGVRAIGQGLAVELPTSILLPIPSPR